MDKSDTAPTSDQNRVEAPGLLAHWHGAKPPAPAWFDAAIADAPTRATIEVDGAQIELLTWGALGAPGLLLLHGNGAHADWWRFLAPTLAQTHRVAAISWSGMGGSNWRDGYTLDGFVAEAMAGAEAAGLFDGPRKPMLVAHSFGGFPSLALAQRHGARWGGVITVDSPLFPPGARDDGPPTRSRPNRVYASADEAVARFRLAPPQPCANDYIVDFIARASLKPAEGGVTWRFDPFLWASFDFDQGAIDPKAAKCPLGVIWGAQSRLCTPAVIDHMRAVYPAGTPFEAVDNAYHHVMLDTPQAFLAALQRVIARL